MSWILAGSENVKRCDVLVLFVEMEPERWEVHRLEACFVEDFFVRGDQVTDLPLPGGLCDVADFWEVWIDDLERD